MLQFWRQPHVPGPVDDGDLGRPEFAPLPDDMPDDSGIAPGQQQFGPAHPGRRAGAENDGANFEF